MSMSNSEQQQQRDIFQQVESHTACYFLSIGYSSFIARFFT